MLSGTIPSGGEVDLSDEKVSGPACNKGYPCWSGGQVGVCVCDLYF